MVKKIAIATVINLFIEKHELRAMKKASIRMIPNEGGV